MKRTYYNYLLELLLAICISAASSVSAQTAATQNSTASTLKLTLPMKEDSARFLAIGDTGSGNKPQYELSRLMVDYRKVFPYEFVIMTGDNIYGKEKAEDMKAKFENVYKPLLDGGVKFYAALGDHDESNQRFYQYFNMNGEEYYRFKKGDVSFYSLNSNDMDKRQIKWLENELAKDASKWKIAFFHHPPYSSGVRHGSSVDLREILEPLFIKYKVDVVFAGHEHFYERVKPQKDIYYFITGAGSKIRVGEVKKNSPLTEKAFDQDLSFMLIEIWKDEMYFQVISLTGETVDSGVIKRRN